MDVYEKYFFDVNGYLVVEDILSCRASRGTQRGD